MKRILLVVALILLMTGLAHADSALLSKLVANDEICSLFYKDEKYIWSPPNVFERKHFTAKESIFDADNDGREDTVRLKENFTRYQTNMMFYIYPTPESNSPDEYSSIFPQSWMECPNQNSDCSLENKISDGILNIGFVPGKTDPIYYRSRYTNAFPFFRDGTTYYKIQTESTNEDVVSIVKPLPNDGKYEVVCAFVTGKKL